MNKTRLQPFWYCCPMLFSLHKNKKQERKTDVREIMMEKKKKENKAEPEKRKKEQKRKKEE